jgi:hypothetical protein
MCIRDSDPAERLLALLLRLFAREVTLQEVPALVDDRGDVRGGHRGDAPGGARG